MSRMMFALCAIAVTSGCHLETISRPISLTGARIETLGPSLHRRDCSDCVPRRPFTCEYYPWCDYHVSEYTAQKCAFRDFKEYRRRCGRPPSHHFKAGFIAAYEDLALNRQPVPRIVPPPKYWNAFYRSCAGEPFVDDWFAGYDAGLEMGSNSGVTGYNELYLQRDCDAGYNDKEPRLATANIDQYQQTSAMTVPAVPAVPRVPVEPPLPASTTVLPRLAPNPQPLQSIP